MSLCSSCHYPIPSWQHNGACKPVAEKLPEKLRLSALEYVRAKREGRPQKLTPRDEVLPRTESRTETPEPVRKPGRPKKWASEAERLAAYRARKPK